MPPHCDSMDGPVVRAAHMALVLEDVALALPYVPEAAEDEVRLAYARTMSVRHLSPEAKELGETHFFETVVRCHRAGEGAPFTGLKPAGLSHGPVVPIAEEAADTGHAEDLIARLHEAVDEGVVHRMAEIIRLAPFANRSVADARRHVSAKLDLQVWSHQVYKLLTTGRDPHAHGGSEAA